MGKFCEHQDIGLGVRCNRCGSWYRYGPPDCPPYITRSEPDAKPIARYQMHLPITGQRSTPISVIFRSRYGECDGYR